jgi:hypothetical protein
MFVVDQEDVNSKDKCVLDQNANKITGPDSEDEFVEDHNDAFVGGK